MPPRKEWSNSGAMEPLRDGEASAVSRIPNPTPDKHTQRHPQGHRSAYVFSARLIKSANGAAGKMGHSSAPCGLRRSAFMSGWPMAEPSTRAASARTSPFLPRRDKQKGHTQYACAVRGPQSVLRTRTMHPLVTPPSGASRGLETRGWGRDVHLT